MIINLQNFTINTAPIDKMVFYQELNLISFETKREIFQGQIQLHLRFETPDTAAICYDLIQSAIGKKLDTVDIPFSALSWPTELAEEIVKKDRTFPVVEYRYF